MRFVLMLLALLTLTAAAPSDVVVDYAGSLVTTMEGPIARAAGAEGLHFLGEARGSTALTHLIESGLRKPDVFISADAALVDELKRQGLIASETTFGSASMVLGYSPVTRFRAELGRAAAGRITVQQLLSTPGLRIGRTDPALDPKGTRTITVLSILGLPKNLGSVYPEEDLLVRLEQGEADVAFLYSTEAIARGLPSLPLPGKASLSDQITYTLAVMKGAPHPEAARRFAAMILSGAGRPILEKAGITYF